MTTQSSNNPGSGSVDEKSTKEFNDYRQKIYEIGTASNEGLVDFYNSMATEHNKLSLGGGYCASVNVTDILVEFVSDRSSKILDAASGTGMVGEELKRRGYTRVDALEPSVKSLDIARQNQTYAEYICDTLDEHQTAIPNDCYDVVLIVGAFGLPGHVGVACFPELIRITKPGGYIMFTVSEYGLRMSKDSMEGAIQAMSEKGAWHLVEYRSIPYQVNVMRKEMAKVPILKVTKNRK